MRVDDLVGHLEKERKLSGHVSARLRLGDSTVEGEVLVDGVVHGTVDGVQVEYTATAEALLTCVRCLTQWAEPLAVEATQHFSKVADEDGYAVRGGEIDMSGPALDEVALAIPSAPLCIPDCMGLCPICGNDLNTEPCDGHGAESDSPFASLKDLFEP